MRVIGLIGTIAYILVILAAGMVNRSLHQQTTPTPTPQGIYGVLLDTNALIYCQIVQQPIDPIFQTATALAQPTLTVTKTPQATWTTVPSSTPNAPTQQLTPVATINVTATPITLTVFAVGGLNVRSCPVGSNPSTSCAIVRLAGFGTYVQATGVTYDGGSIEWRKLVDGTWIAEFINGGQVLGQ